ncbi:MAG: T9SS type A sorting domain-containing protein, partial [Bacteroidia bacterium]
ANGNFKKITILNLTSGAYNFKYSDIDGSNEKIKKVDKADFKNKNFGYYSFDTETALDREPLTTEWDIVFTKYMEFIPTPYAVGGIWTNKGAKTAEAKKVPVTTTNYGQFSFTETNSEIGYDWKTYNQPLNKYMITDSLVYFVNNKDVIHKIVFTGYKGGAAGMYYFTKKTLTGSVHFPTLTTSLVYPNPASGNLIIQLAADNSLSNYKIITIAGQTVLTGTENSIDISGLSSGIYYITLNTDKGIQTIKFTKTSL